MWHEVFLSSTQKDLRPYREAVSLRLHKAGYAVIEMEQFAASDEEPLQACLREVFEAELFVGIYACRYGFVPQSSNISITEEELRVAERGKKHVFCFLLDESKQKDWPVEFCETGVGTERLTKLRERIKTSHLCATFASPGDLATKVELALSDWEKRRPQESLSPERLLLFLLLEKVQRFWIDNVFRKSVPTGRRLQIRRVEELEADWRRAAKDTKPPEAEIEDGLEPLRHVLSRHNRLLILGQPGAGKTIALIELARGLGELTRFDPNAPVPVIFNLASWRGRHQDLAGWMEEELHVHYHASVEQAHNWVDRNSILPLLDALDEVEDNFRSACVEAINGYLGKIGINCQMVVSCHTQVYKDLDAHLDLEWALELQPLTPNQVDAHLAAAGSSLAGLRNTIAKDPDFRELSASPLMLILLQRTWRDRDPASASPMQGSPEDQAFEKYVEGALEPELGLPWTLEKDLGQFPSKRTRRLLEWLARGMAAHGHALFQLERLQPAWLETPEQLWTYALLSRALGGALVVLPLVLVPQLSGFWRCGLAAVALLGATEVTWLRRSESQAANRKARSLARSVGRTSLILGEVVALVFSIEILPFFLLGVFDSRQIGDPTLTSLWLGLPLGLVFGSRGAGRGGGNDIRVRERLVLNRWSWRSTRHGAIWGLAASLVVWAADALATSLSHLDSLFLAIAVVFVLGGSAIGGALGSLGGEPIEKTERPNQGTRLALRNAGMVALVSALATTLALYLLFWGFEVIGHSAGYDRIFVSRDLWRTPVAVGATLGFWIGLWYSGLDFLQHYVLRLVLRLWNLVPGRLVSFLNHATERGLMQRVGGDYRFFHDRLLQYFTLEKPQEDGR
jgi:uncharacterized protein DUF4062